MAVITYSLYHFLTHNITIIYTRMIVETRVEIRTEYYYRERGRFSPTAPYIFLTRVPDVVNRVQCISSTCWIRTHRPAGSALRCNYALVGAVIFLCVPIVLPFQSFYEQFGRTSANVDYLIRALIVRIFEESMTSVDSPFDMRNTVHQYIVRYRME